MVVSGQGTTETSVWPQLDGDTHGKSLLIMLSHNGHTDVSVVPCPLATITIVVVLGSYHNQSHMSAIKVGELSRNFSVN